MNPFLASATLFITALFCGFVGATSNPLINDDTYLSIFIAQNARNKNTHNERTLNQASHLLNQGLVGFNSSASLSTKTIQEIQLIDQQQLTPTKQQKAEIGGWSNYQNFLSWNGGVGNVQPLSLQLENTSQNKEEINLNKFNAIWVDYLETSNFPVCKLRLSLKTRIRSHDQAPKVSEISWNAGNAFTERILWSINATKSKFINFDFFFIMGRLLGLAPDENWRYRQINKFELFQRRMHESLKDALFLDVVVEPGTVLERVNLHVRNQDGIGNSDIVEFTNLPAPSLLPNGGIGLRINLREALVQHFPNKFSSDSYADRHKSLFLEEIFIYKSKGDHIISNLKPIRGLSLLVVDIQDENNIYISSEIENLNGLRRRLKVNLNPVNMKGRSDLLSSEIKLYPNNIDDTCLLRLDTVRLVSTSDQKIPVFVKQVEDWTRRWGGPFKLKESQYGKVEQPGILSYLSLSEASDPQAGQRQDNYTHNYFNIAKSEKITNSRLWQFEDNQKLLYLNWYVDTIIKPDTLFFIGASDSKDHRTAAITIHTKDGRRLSRLFEINQAINLVNVTAQVKSIEVAINSNALRDGFRLRELALFEPSVISYDEAFSLGLPRHLKVLPKPIVTSYHNSVIRLRPGHVSFPIFSNIQDLKFSTHLGAPFQNIRGLNIKYSLPNGFVMDGQCPIILKFKFKNTAVQHPICPNLLKGQVYVSLATLLSKLGIELNLNDLQSIEWTLHLPNENKRNDFQTLTLDFYVDGWLKQSVADQLQITPLFEVDGKPVYAKQVDLSFNGGKLGNMLQLPLEENTFARLLDSKGSVTPVYNELFKVEQVVLRPTKKLDQGTWQKLINPPEPAALPRWSKWLFWATSLLMLVWISARKDFWLSKRVGLVVFRKVNLIYWTVRKVSVYIGGRIWFMLPWTATWEIRLPGLARAISWYAITFVLFFAGLFQKVHDKQNYFFIFGAMTAVLAMSASFFILKSYLFLVSPSLARLIFRSAGSLYFSAAIVGLIGAALLVSISLEPIAQQVALLVYYCLVVGIVLELTSLRRERPRSATEPDASLVSKPTTLI